MPEKKAATAKGASGSERYLVFEARWNERFLQRFGFALRDEASLREPTAGITVVGIGLVLGDASVSTGDSSDGGDPKNNPEKSQFSCEGISGAESPKQDPRYRGGLSGTRRIAVATLQYALAASVLMFYSKNVLGAALRALVGG